MKNKLLLIAFFITALFTACDNEEVQKPASEIVEVAFSSLTTGSYSEELTKTGTYDRGTAPVYLSGINITADNQDDTNYKDVDATFYFVDFVDGNNDGIHDGGGEPLSMEVKYGSNLFKATSITDNSPVSVALAYYFSSKKEISKTLEEKAAAYSAQLLTDYPLYAKYYGETTQNIVLLGQNTVELSLAPQNGRVNVVFETEDAGQHYLIALRDANQIAISQFEHIGNDQSASAIVFNTNNTTDINYDVIVYKKAVGNANWESTKVYPFEADLGENTTYVLRHSNSVSSMSKATSFKPVYNID